MELHSIKVHPRYRVAANDDIQAVISRVEQIATMIPGLSNQLRSVVSFVRGGAITNAPNEVYYYLIGALHALNLADDDFFELQDALNFLLPDGGVETFPAFI